jgi:hypothetical protein
MTLEVSTTSGRREPSAPLQSDWGDSHSRARHRGFSDASSFASAVVAAINNGRSLRGGPYTLIVRSGGIQDVAGNALDGHFFGTFPSGDGAAGGDFAARLDSIHDVIFPPAPLNSTASPLFTPDTPGRSVLIPTKGVASKPRPQHARAWNALLRRHASTKTRGPSSQEAGHEFGHPRPQRA